MKKKIVGITQGLNQPSRRFRWSQYLDYLQDSFEVTELVSYFCAYPPASKIIRPLWGATTLIESGIRTVRANYFDLCFLQKTFISTLCSWEPFLRKPFVYDVDDAIFLHPRGYNADKIARISSLIICGNNFLANHFSEYNKNIVILPTAVDTVRFTPSETGRASRIIIGWSGSSGNLKYLYLIEDAIKEILIRYPDALFKIVSDQKPLFNKIPSDRIFFEKWSPVREVAALQEFTIGIMPLDNDLWSRGKCSFKMLTYMSVGIPVVVSPVGMNEEILTQAQCGFPARSKEEWVDAISTLLSDESLCREMGEAGRRLIETKYSKNVIAPQLVQLLHSQLSG